MTSHSIQSKNEESLWDIPPKNTSNPSHSIKLTQTLAKIQSLRPEFVGDADSQSLSKKITLIAGKTSAIGPMFDLQDSAQGAMRNTASLVQNFVGHNEILGEASSVDGALCSFAYMIVRGLSFRTALQKVPTAFQYGDALDKLDALCNVFRTGISTLLSALGTVKNIGALFAWTALSIPLAILGIIFLSIWAIKSILAMVRMIQMFERLNHAFKQGTNDKQNILALVEFMAEVDRQLEKENAELRGQEYKILLEQLENCPLEDSQGRESIQKRLAELRESSPEREVFLRERKLANLISKYGLGTVKHLQEYEQIKHELKNFETIKRSFKLDLDNGIISLEKYNEKLNEIQQHEDLFLKKSLGWFQSIKEAMQNCIGIQGTLLAATIFGILGGVFGLLTAKIWIPVALILAILASVMWIIYDAKSWDVQKTVTKSQNKWIRELLSKYLEQNNFINEQNITKFECYYIPHAQLKHKNVSTQDRIEFVKKHLRQKILKDPTLDADIDHELLTYLSSHSKGTLSSNERESLRCKIDKIYLSLGNKGTRQDQIKRELQTVRFIEHTIAESKEQLQFLIQNCHYTMKKISEKVANYSTNFTGESFSSFA